MGNLKTKNFGSINNLIQVCRMLTVQLFQNEISILPFEIMSHDNSLFSVLVIGKGMDPAEEFSDTVFPLERVLGIIQSSLGKKQIGDVIPFILSGFNVKVNKGRFIIILIILIHTLEIATVLQ